MTGLAKITGSVCIWRLFLIVIFMLDKLLLLGCLRYGVRCCSADGIQGVGIREYKEPGPVG